MVALIDTYTYTSTYTNTNTNTRFFNQEKGLLLNGLRGAKNILFLTKLSMGVLIHQTIKRPIRRPVSRSWPVSFKSNLGGI